MKKLLLFSVLFLALLTVPACDSVSSPVLDNTPSVFITIPTESEAVHTTTEQQHIHSFMPATCIAPKTCSVCGETEGKKLSHNYTDATCQAPRTCTVCSKTIGNVAAHAYTNGACAFCGAKEPVDSDNAVWIPTKGGKKYHAVPSCSNMKDPSKVTKDEAESRGFTPCKRCH